MSYELLVLSSILHRDFFNGLIFVFTSGEVTEAIKHVITKWFHKAESHGDSTVEPTVGPGDPSTASFLLHKPSEFDDAPFYAPISVPPVTHFDDETIEDEPEIHYDPRYQKLINES